MLIHRRGESGIGTWTIIVKDTEVNEHSGKFIDWHLKLWGEARDASKATLLPMPTEEDDNDHAQLATTTLAASVTALPPSSTPNAAGNPQTTDIPNRPVNSKPSSPPAPGTTQGAEPAPETSGASNSTWLPSFLPTFGVSSATQAWIYGSLVLIVLFCAGLGVYLFLARRKRLRNNPRNDYEFELLDDAEEAEGLASGGRGGEREKGVAGGRRGGRTRGGELYDAFAGESDDEDGEGGSEGFVEAGYRDRRGSGSEGSGSAIGVSEKLPGRRGVRDEEEEEHHVVGDDDDEEEESSEEESEEERPLQAGR